MQHSRIHNNEVLGTDRWLINNLRISSGRKTLNIDHILIIVRYAAGEMTSFHVCLARATGSIIR
ncbi:hypothetical protein PHET_08231 [Paragonimus heterotremus]|uniref:Uncharacterized protein n=1 Tax=Paragonimus heterotremus TaxID=100268 RepID=A0A8J4SFE7_9TREM|nr:hypothetical protein PHET_08231 [Paragonimus heterotremus]